MGYPQVIITKTSKNLENKLKEISDDIIIGMLSDDKQFDGGFKRLVQKYQEPLYWHIRRMVHFHEDADDVIQNVFIKVFRGIKGFKGDSKLYTWLYKIATNESITFINKKKKISSVTEHADDDILSSKLKADTYFDSDQAQLILVKAVESLPQKQKQIFNLRYYDNMTYKDMSEVLDTSVGALKASYHHAVKKIENYLKANV